MASFYARKLLGLSGKNKQSESKEAPKTVEQGGARRRVQIVNASEDFAPDSGEAPAIFSKSDSTKIAICDALQNHFLFSSLSRETVLAIVDTMAPAVKYAGEDIIVQGDVGHAFYCLERGSADVFVNGNKVASYADGGCFGELALMYNDKRAATVRATSECQLWSLEQRTFRRILANTASSSMMARCEFLKRVPLLQPLSNEQINKLAGALSHHSFKRGQYIIHQGAIGDMFYIIQDGTVRCTQIKAHGQEILLLELGPGEYFGEMALMLDEPRHANCIAQTDVQCLALTRAQFVELLGPLQELLGSRMRIRILRSVPLLSRLTDEQLDRIAQAMRVQTFTDGEYIIREGQQGTRFYMINEGMVRCTQVDQSTGQHKELVQLRPQEFFGERALIKQEPRKANVIAMGDVECLVLERSDFLGLLEDIRGILVDEMQRRETAKDEPQVAVAATRGPSTSYRFEDLVQIRTIGTGTFGRVKVVQHKPTGKVYALKCMSKADLVEARQEQNIMSEKNILYECRHPFVLELFQTFNHQDQIYMLMEMVQGGELWSYVYERTECIQRNARGGFEESAVKFYTACVLSAFQHIHGIGVAYRDLKPENILIDSHGYCKIVDFGFAKHFPYMKDGVEMSKTYTLCGTPEYLAPEIVMSHGHDKSVDLWAIGCLIYEFMLGRTPFQDDFQPRIFDKIIHSSKNLVFPRGMDQHFENIVRRLLEPNPTFRLGNLHGGVREIMTHPYFSGFNWAQLETRQMQPPFVPAVSDPLDTSNFDPYEENDEVLPYTGADEPFADF